MRFVFLVDDGACMNEYVNDVTALDNVKNAIEGFVKVLKGIILLE